MRQLYRVVSSYFMVVPVTVAAMIVLAAIIHRFVEVPTNRLGRRLGARPPTAPVPPSEVVVVPG